MTHFSRNKINISISLLISFLLGLTICRGIHQITLFNSYDKSTQEYYLISSSTQNSLLSQSTFNSEKSGKVFICKGPKSKRYHYTKSCIGLKNCSTPIFEVSLKEARDLDRTLCGFED